MSSSESVCHNLLYLRKDVRSEVNLEVAEICIQVGLIVTKSEFIA